jgi:hypothetical protein
MTRLLAFPCVRVLLLFVVVWTIADAALYGVCADDPVGFGGARETSVAAGGSHGHPSDASLHAHHCFCHAQWVGLTDTSLPQAPARSSELAADGRQRPPDTPTRRLDHPPQLPA